MLHVFNYFSFRKCLEHSCCIHSDLLIRRHKRKVCIKSCCLFIVVSGSDLCDVLDSIFSSACNQAKFGMHFIMLQSINNLASGLLKHSGPTDIILLIKTCSKLYENNDFFSIFCRLAKCLDDLALFCQSIQCHLNRNDTVILCCFCQHFQERSDGIIWIG